jgi:polyphosphate kinase
MIDLQLGDNVKARVIDKDQKNEYIKNELKQKIRSQKDIYSYIQKVG